MEIHSFVFCLWIRLCVEWHNVGSLIHDTSETQPTAWANMEILLHLLLREREKEWERASRHQMPLLSARKFIWANLWSHMEQFMSSDALCTNTTRILGQNFWKHYWNKLGLVLKLQFWVLSEFMQLFTPCCYPLSSPTEVMAIYEMSPMICVWKS